eukprot:6178678-Pleurochrysis_carterae.AAC.3
MCRSKARAGKMRNLFYKLLVAAVVAVGQRPPFTQERERVDAWRCEHGVRPSLRHRASCLRLSARTNSLRLQTSKSRTDRCCRDDR